MNASLRRILQITAFFLFLFFPLVMEATQASLELLSPANTQTVRLRLSGDSTNAYQIETSADLATWTEYQALTTTNGSAELVLQLNLQGRLFIRAYQAPLIPEITLQLLRDENLSFSAIVTPDGGAYHILMPDFRQMTLAFPRNAISVPTEITVSVITNFANLPFAQGSFGGIKLEPANLQLAGVAALTIPYTPGIDARTVASFSTENDGSLLSIAPDRAHTNDVIIPFTRFATYGAAVATRAELESILGPLPIATNEAMPEPALKATSLGLLQPRHRPCVLQLEQRGDVTGGPDQFNESSKQCYPENILRALSVQRELNLFIRCEIQPDIATLIATERQRQMLFGEEAGAPDFSSLGNQICNIYTNVLEPLWIEATNNCALSRVMLQFMLGFEQQMQVLGFTNAPCNYTLTGNLAKLCASAKNCIQEIRICCARGHRGQEKFSEIRDIINRFDLLGSDCFPKGMEDPDVLEALDTCLTNTWYGTFTMTERGDTTKVTNDPTTSSVTTERKVIDVKYEGAVYASNEGGNIPGLGKMIGLTVLGTGIVKLEDTFHSIQRLPCPTNGFSENVFYSRINTYGLTNGTYDTNFSAGFGAYSFAFLLKPDNTYQITAVAGPLLMVKVKDYNYNTSVPCSGRAETFGSSTFEGQTGSVFPPIGEPLVFPLDDTNHIRGTYRTFDTSGDDPIPIDFSWNFFRVQQR